MYVFKEPFGKFGHIMYVHYYYHVSYIIIIIIIYIYQLGTTQKAACRVHIAKRAAAIPSSSYNYDFS